MANGEVRPPASRPQGPPQSAAGGFGIWARQHVPFLVVALLVVGIGGYLWYKHEKNKSSTATTSGSDLLTQTESGDLDTIASNTTAEVAAINQLYGALVSSTPVPPSTTVPTTPSSPTAPTSPAPPTNTGPPPAPVVGTPPGYNQVVATPPAPVVPQAGFSTATSAAQTLTSAPAGVPSNLGKTGITPQTGVEPSNSPGSTNRITPKAAVTKTAATKPTTVAGAKTKVGTGVQGSGLKNSGL